MNIDNFELLYVDEEENFVEQNYIMDENLEIEFIIFFMKKNFKNLFIIS